MMMYNIGNLIQIWIELGRWCRRIEVDIVLGIIGAGIISWGIGYYD
jgi:hypothetical protein